MIKQFCSLYIYWLVGLSKYDVFSVMYETSNKKKFLTKMSTGQLFKSLNYIADGGLSTYYTQCLSTVTHKRDKLHNMIKRKKMKTKINKLCKLEVPIGNH